MVEKKISEQIDEIQKNMIGKTELIELKEILSKNKKLLGEKKLRIGKPSNARIKKGWVIVVVIGKNNSWDFRKLPVIDSNIQLPENKTYHMADTEYIGIYKNKFPIVVIPEWSNEPLTKEVLTRTVDENKSNVKSQIQIIHLMESARLAETQKPKKSSKGLLVIGALLVGVYLIGKQMGWF